MLRSVLIALLAQLLAPAPKPGHAAILASPAEVSGKAGERVTLFVDVMPKPSIHVYAPGNQDFIPITVKLNPQTEIKPGRLAYPKSEVVTIADERVSVFQKPFRLAQDVTINRSAQAGSTIDVAGTVRYQACDDAVCYPPESAPVSWAITVR
jgi:hypothetical protein